MWTHIRTVIDPALAYCGERKPVHSINRQHFDERLTKPAIAGQLERLPEPMCPGCVKGAA